MNLSKKRSKSLANVEGGGAYYFAYRKWVAEAHEVCLCGMTLIFDCYARNGPNVYGAGATPTKRGSILCERPLSPHCRPGIPAGLSRVNNQSW